jgi:hypothetical protein
MKWRDRLFDFLLACAALCVIWEVWAPIFAEPGHRFEATLTPLAAGFTFLMLAAVAALIDG